MEENTVLLIESNDKINQFLTHYVFAGMNYKTVEARSQKEALENALLLNPDVILLGSIEGVSPDLNFLSLLQQTGCSSPVILLTKDESKFEIYDAFRKGIRDFIVFPVEIEKARQIIRVVIASSKEQHHREVLNKHLLTTEAVQITVTTLSHYINNYITALDGNLTLLHESCQADQLNDLYNEIIRKSQLNLNSIKTVLRVLLSTTSFSFTQYDDSFPMIDIRSALLKELNRADGE